MPLDNEGGDALDVVIAVATALTRQQRAGRFSAWKAGSTTRDRCGELVGACFERRHQRAPPRGTARRSAFAADRAELELEVEVDLAVAVLGRRKRPVVLRVLDGPQIVDVDAQARLVEVTRW
jgi:hypothetical protein